MNEDNPGTEYAKELGVDVEDLHVKLSQNIEGQNYIFTKEELKVLQACLEVACEF